MAIRTLKMLALVFQTAAATKSVTFGPGDGDFSLSGLEEGDTSAIQVMDRGTHHELVDGPDKALTASVTVRHNTVLTSAGTSRIMDAVRGTGNYSGETTADAGGVVWTGNVIATVTHPNGEVDTFTLRNVRLVADYADAENGNTMTINMTIYGNGSSSRPVSIASA